ncbi:hypothetical protein BCR35DRAFT_353438 [Leucosporidium creatinivorum]|uniref:Ser-Thr-rich glycosyl-phosphatidyl-inositol-anchored membrane family-domain-containing protein n=1 Tax=Leucosporidium creatinivorum TaxID=106004 RepID=A0A1Y2EXE1_9BASI|nr:hypothetical protein BCR35DRAFT_353438 [Leucosporidium creatinivorum]
MRSFTLAAAALSLASSALATVNSPASLIECQPTLLSWTATTSPYYLSIIEDGDASNIAENLGTFTNTSYTWTVDLASGTNVSIALTDGTGQAYYSSSVLIIAGSSTSCLGTNSATTETAAGSTAASSSAASASGSSSAKSSSSGTASSSASSSSSSSSTTSGATTLQVGSGLFALAAGVAAFAL